MTTGSWPGFRSGREVGKNGYLRLRCGAYGLHERTSLSSFRPAQLHARSQRNNWGSMDEGVWLLVRVRSAGVEEGRGPVDGR